MSTSVDNRVVQMQFDNAQFEAGISQSLQTLERLDKALDSLESSGGFSGLSQSISDIGNNLDNAFSFKGVAALTTFKNVATDLYEFVKGTFSNLANNFIPVNFIDQIMSGGFRRAQNIEQAKFQLEGLGTSWEVLAKDINYAVDQTAYGLDAAGKAASQLVASGVAYGDTFGDTGNSPMAKALRGISGLAAMTNSTYEDISQLFTTIAGKGRMQAEELNRFAYRGVNMSATLAKEINSVLDGTNAHIGKYSDDVLRYIYELTDGAKVSESTIREFASDGQISFALFSEAANAAFGEHATKANETYAGSLSNVRAALSRIGADYYQQHLEGMVKVFNGLRLAINSFRTSLQPAIAELNKFDQGITGAMTRLFRSDSFKSILNSIALAGAKILEIFNRLRHIIELTFESGSGHGALETFADQLAKVVDAFSQLHLTENALVGIYNIFNALVSVASIFWKALTAVFYILSPWLEVLNTALATVLGWVGELSLLITHFDYELTDASRRGGLRTFIDTLWELSNVLAIFATLVIADPLSALRMLIGTFGILVDVIKTFGLILLSTLPIPLALVASLVGAISPFITAIVQVFSNAEFAISLFADRLRTAFGNGGIIGLVLEFIEICKVIPATLAAVFRPLTSLITSTLAPIFTPIINKFQELKGKIEEFGSSLFESLPTKFQDLMTRFQEFIDSVIESFRTIGENIRNVLLTPFDELTNGNGFLSFVDQLKVSVLGIPAIIAAGFKPVASTIETFFTSKFNQAKIVVDEFINSFREGGFTGLFEEIAAQMSQFGESIQTVFTELKDRTIPFIVSSITNAFSSLIEKFPALQTVVDLAKTIKTAIQNVFTTIYEFIAGENGVRKIFSSMVEAGRAAIEGLVQGFLDGSIIGSLFDAIRAIVGSKESGTGIIGFFASLVGWHSPWEVFIEAAKDAVRGLVQGFLDSSVGQALQAALKSIADTILHFLEPIMPKIVALGKWLKDNITFENLVSTLTTLKGVLGSLASTIAEFGGKALTFLVNKLIWAKDVIVDFFNSIRSFKLGKISLENILPDLSEISKSDTILGKFVRGLSSIFEKVKSAFGVIIDMSSGKYGAVIQQALGITMLIAIPQLIVGFLRAVDTAKKGLDVVKGAIKGLFGTVDKVFKFFGDISKTIAITVKLAEFRKTLIAMAGLIGVIGIVVYSLSTLTPDQFARAQEILSYMAGLFLFLGVCMMVCENIRVPNLGSTKSALVKSVSSFVEIAALIISFSIAAFALAKAFEILKNLNLNLDTIGPPLVALGTMVLTLAAAVAALGVASPKIASGAITLLAVAFAVKQIVDVYMMLLGICDVFLEQKKKDTLDEAFNALILVMAGITIVSVAAAAMGAKGGIGLLALLASFLILEKVFDAIINFSFSYKKLIANLESILSAVALVGLLLIATQTAGKHSIGAGVVILALGVSLKLIFEVFDKLVAQSKRLNPDKLKTIVGSLIGIMLSLAALIASTKDASLKSVAVIASITGLIGFVTLMISLVSIIGAINPDGLERAGQVMTYTMLMLATVVAATRYTEKAKPAVLLFLIADIIAVMLSLTVLSLMPTDGLITALIGMSLVFGLLAAFAKSTEKLKGMSLAGMLVLVLDIIAVAGALALLAQFDDWASVLFAALSLSGVMLALAGVTKIIKGNDWKTIGQIAALAGVCAIAAVSLGMLSNYDWPNILFAAVGIAGVMLALGEVTNLLKSVEWKSIGQMVVLAGIALAITYVLSTMASYPWMEILKAVGIFALVLGVLVGAVALLSLIPASGAAGITLIEIAAACLIFGAAAWVLGEAAIAFAEAVRQIHDSGIELGEVKEIIVTVVSGIVEGIVVGLVQGLMSGLEMIGAALMQLGSLLLEKIQALLPEDFDFGEWIKEKFNTAVTWLTGTEEGTLIGSVISLGEQFSTALQSLIPEDFDLITAIKNLFQPVIDFFIGTEEGSLLGTLTSAKDSIVEFFTNLIPQDIDILGSVTAAIQPIIDYFISTGEGSLLGSLITVKDSIVEFFTNLIPQDIDILGTIQTAFKPIIDYLLGTEEGSLIGSFKKAGEDAIDNLVKSLEDGIKSLGEIPGKIVDAIIGDEKTGIASLKDKMIERGRAAIDGLIKGITDFDIIQALKDGGHSVVAFFLEAFDDEAGYNSPWTTTVERARAALEGLAEGLDDGPMKANLQNLAASLADLVIDSAGNEFESGFDALGNYVRNRFNSLLSSVGGLDENGKFNLAGIGKKLLGDLDIGKYLDDAKNSVEELTNSLGGGGQAWGDYGGAAGGAGKSAGGAGKSSKEAAEAAKKHAKAVELQNKVIEEFNEIYGEAYEAIGETAAIDACKEAIEELAKTFGQTGEDIEETEKTIEELFLDMYDTIKEAIDGSIDMFEAFSTENSISADKLLDNMKSNIDAIQVYEETMQSLAKRGFSKSVLEELAKEGPKAQSKANTMLKMTFDQMNQMNAFQEQKIKAVADATIGVITAMAYATQTQEAVAKMAAAGAEDAESAAKKALLDVAAQIDRTKVTYRELYQTVKDTVAEQIDMFSKFDKKTDLSASELLENMRSQIDGMRSWGAKMTQLANSGVDDGILVKLAELGPKGYEYVNAFSQMTADELAEASALWQESMMMPENIATMVSTSYLNHGMEIANNMLVGVQQELAASQAAIAESSKVVGDGMVDGVNQEIINGKPVINESVRQLMDDMIDGANNELIAREGEIPDTIGGIAESSIERFKEINDSNSPSRVYRDLAIDMLDGLQLGIDEEHDPTVEKVVTLAEDMRRETEEGLKQEYGIEYGRNLGMGVAIGIEESTGPAVAAATAFAMAVNAAFATVNQIASPSKVWIRFGSYLGEGVAIGLDQSTDAAADSAINLGEMLNSALSYIADAVDDDFVLDPTIRPVVDLSDVEAKAQILNSMFSEDMIKMGSNISNIRPMSSQIMRGLSGIRQGDTTTYGNISVNVYAAPGQNASEIADMTLDKLNRQIRRQKAAFA